MSIRVNYLTVKRDELHRSLNYGVELRFRTLIAALTFAVLALPASAVTFQHVCTSAAACDNDDDFSFTITLADSVVIAGGSYNTIVDGGAGLLGWTASSSVGNGFVISGGITDVTGAGSGITFSFDVNAVLRGIEENSAGSLFRFSRPQGAVSFSEGNPGTFIDRRDVLPIGLVDRDDIVANWQVAPSPVPLPAGLPLVVTALAGFAGLRMRKKRTSQA